MGEFGDLIDDVVALRRPTVELEDVQRPKEWTTSTKNPDWNLVEIHGANSGFMAKGSTKEGVGSYLVYFFTKRVREEAVKRNGLDLAGIMERIQNVLHNKGKQQTQNIFNNNTRTLQMKRNRT